jgi:hypothetical protein
MTNYPTMPALPPPPPEGPRTTRNNKLVAAVGFAVVAALGVGVFAGTWIDSDATGGKTSASERPESVDPVEEPDVFDDAGPKTVYVTPTASDFTIELKVKSKQCFGSAGCNVVVEPELSYDGLSSELDPEATFDITYEISGGDSGEIVETLELSNQEDVSFSETLVSTSSSSVTPKVKITDVSGW